MKKLLILPVLLFVSCAPRTYMTGYDREKVKSYSNIAIIEPTFSLIEIDEKYKRQIYDYDTEMKNIFTSEYVPYVTASNSLYLSSDSLSIKKDTLLWLISMSFQSKKVDSNLVNQILPQKGNSSKLLISHMSGFYKTDKLIRWERTKSILWAICTLGMYYPLYYEYLTAYDVVMIDLETYNVVYKENRRELADMRQKETIASLIKASTKR